MAETETRTKNATGPRIEDTMVVEKVEAIIERINSHKAVEGVIIVDKDGAAIQTTMDNTNTVMFAETVRNTAALANSFIRDVDPEDELRYIRIGTKKLELLAHLDPEYTAIVIQGRIKASKKNNDFGR